MWVDSPTYRIARRASVILSSNRGTFVYIFGAMLLSCMLVGDFQPSAALAAESAEKAGDTATRFATVDRIRGEITAMAGETGLTRTLRPNDVVFVGERIRAAASAEAVLKTDDAGRIAIRPQAEFVVERFAAQGKPTDYITLHLHKGGLRLITGWIGRNNHALYKVNTLTATIGIRGTDHEPYEMSYDLAETLSQNEGTYDKVNRGGTTMDANGNKLDIDPGKVGFARKTEGQVYHRSIRFTRPINPRTLQACSKITGAPFRRHAPSHADLLNFHVLAHAYPAPPVVRIRLHCGDVGSGLVKPRALQV